MSIKSKAIDEKASRKCVAADWQTPKDIIDAVKQIYGGRIELDPATTPSNPVDAGHFFTPDRSGLVRGWGFHGDVFVNPPYGRELRQWVEKIGLEARKGCRIIALLPANRLETIYLQKAIFHRHLDAMVLLRRRLAFIDASTGLAVKNNTFGSILYCFGIAPSLLWPLSKFGTVIKTHAMDYDR